MNSQGDLLLQSICFLFLPFGRESVTVLTQQPSKYLYAFLPVLNHTADSNHHHRIVVKFEESLFFCPNSYKTPEHTQLDGLVHAHTTANQQVLAMPLNGN